MEIPNVSKISDYIPFSKDGNLQLFEVFRLYSLFKGWKSPTFRSFPIIFPFHRMEISNVSKISNYIPFSRMEISNISKFSDYIPFS